MLQQAPSPQVLIVEDEPQLRRELCRSLQGWGLAVHEAPTGAQALQCWQDQPLDLVVLDLGLPDMDGLDVLRHARRLHWHARVLVLTARGLVGDRVLGLNFGADEYLTKPFDFEELRARVQALLRRSRPSHLLDVHAALRRELGRLRWTEGAGQFFCDDQPLVLSTREAAMLRALVERPNQARPRQALVAAVFPQSQVREEALEVVAFRLRRKLAPCGVVLFTLRGLGYLIKADAPPPAPTA